jgi:hypothetical protein
MSQNTSKTGAKWILWGVIVGLLVFTAIRTVHFLQKTFPPDQQSVAYLALVAFDVGVLAWLFFASKAAEGNGQRTVSYGMIFVCGAGVLAATAADMLMVSKDNGITDKIPPDIAIIAIWAVIIVICANVAAGILVHLLDPEHQRHMAQERARDKIHASIIANIESEADDVAPRIAAAVRQHWSVQIVNEMTGMIPNKGNGQAPALPPGSKTVEPDPALNQANLVKLLDAMGVPPDHMDEKIEELRAKGVVPGLNGRGKKKSVASGLRQSPTRSGGTIASMGAGPRISPRTSETGTRRTCKRFDYGRL